MAFNISLEGTDLRKNMKATATRNYRRVALSARDAINRVNEEIETEWAADVAKAGNFGQRWVDALKFKITPRTGVTVNISTVTMITIPYWRVHEFGAVIKGKPLLWIPLPWTGIKVRARDYNKRGGRLFRVDRKGGKNPLLLSARDGEPKYVGVKQVKLRQRFHLRRIIRRAAKNFEKYYRAAYRRRKGM